MHESIDYSQVHRVFPMTLLNAREGTGGVIKRKGALGPVRSKGRGERERSSGKKGTRRNGIDMSSFL